MLERHGLARRWIRLESVAEVASVVEVRSDRLVGRQPSREDVQGLRAIYSTPEVSRWLSPTGRPATQRETARKVSRDPAHWQTNGIGRWYWHEIDTGILVARCGPQLSVVCGNPEIELHWAVRPDRQGRGYATEAANAAADTCFNVLSLSSIVAYANADNIASLGVMKNTGFLFEQTFDLNDRPHVLHRRVYRSKILDASA